LFEACFNFRDLGGYASIDEREVRPGALYRSDSLHRLSANDLVRLKALGVRTVIDLRTAHEIAVSGRIAEDEQRVFRHIPCQDPTDEYLQPRADLYFAFTHIRGPEIASAFRSVAFEAGPIVSHCMAGKDRTGIVAALLLAALGVPDVTISSDYALTERSLAPALAWATEHDPEWAAWLTEVAPTGLLGTPADAMSGFLGMIRSEYGSIDLYLAQAGVDAPTMDALRARYLA
jgi:protein tyrosine/serine phosphatase